MITSDRWWHTLSVARKAKELARKIKPNDEKYAEDMFLLGLLHDFGYEFTTGEHAKIGGEVLKRNGYRYWREIMFHGCVEDCDMTDESFILNCADMTIGPDGKDMTFEERLEDIAARHGKTSRAYEMSFKEISVLKKDKRCKLI